MFGNNSKKESGNMSNSSPDSSIVGGINSLGNGTKVVGDLTAQNDIRIDGELEGNLNCNGKVILGPKGIIKGNVICQSAVVEGSINGTVKVKDILQVKESAKIVGEITTEKLMVQPGAIFNVKCEMGGQKIVPQSKMESVKSA